MSPWSKCLHPRQVWVSLLRRRQILATRSNKYPEISKIIIPPRRGKYFVRKVSILFTPPNLAAAVHIVLIDNVLDLLLIWIDSPAEWKVSSPHLLSPLIYLCTHALLKAKMSSLVDICPSLLWSKSLKACWYLSTSSGLRENLGFISSLVAVLPRILAVLPRRLAIPPGGGGGGPSEESAFCSSVMLSVGGLKQQQVCSCSWQCHYKKVIKSSSNSNRSIIY